MNPQSSTLIETTTARKIRRFLDGTARFGQFSYMFGQTGRGKTFITKNWIAKHGNAAYVRARTGVTQSGLRRQISEAIFCDDSYREREIMQYFMEHPGFVLVIDEANSLLSDGSLRSAKCLNSIRDYHDEVTEAGSKMGVVFIFTEYSLDRLKTCRIASFLKQFINRGDNHLCLPAKISRAYEIIPTLKAYVDEPSADLIREACEFQDIRSLHKRLQMAKLLCEQKHIPLSGELLLALQLQYETGDYSDDNDKADK